MQLRLLFLLLLAATAAKAQYTISGKVLSMVNKQPVADASVFLSNSSIGTKTAADGTYTLYNVKNGQYDLVVSHVGYESGHQTVFANTNLQQPVIELMPRVTELKEVKIKYDANRNRYYTLFKREFLGSSENGKDCIIKNPDIIDFDYDRSTQILKASTTDFLIVENRALGYIIKYLLVEFAHNPRAGSIFYAGSAVFTPMKGKPSEERRWRRKRLDAYYGSSMHFLRSALAARIPEENFTVRRLIRSPNPDRAPDSLIEAKVKRMRFLATPANPFPDSLRYWNAEKAKPKYITTLVKNPLPADDFIRLTDRRDIFAFGYKDCLQITYKNREMYTSTLTFMVPYAYFDLNGIVLNPHSNTMEGYWASQRIGELLPVDYVLEGK